MSERELYETMEGFSRYRAESEARKEQELKDRVRSFFAKLDDQVSFFQSRPDKAYFFKDINLPRKLQILASLRRTGNSNIYSGLIKYLDAKEEEAEIEAQAREKNQREAATQRQTEAQAREKTQREEAEVQRQKQAEAQANDTFQAYLNAKNAEKTPRTRARNTRKVERNLANLLASPNNGPINQQLARGRAVRLANPNSTAEVLENSKEEAEDAHDRLVSGISSSTNIGELNNLYNTVLERCRNLHNAKITLLREANKLPITKERTKKLREAKNIDDIFVREFALSKLIKNKLYELDPSRRPAVPAKATPTGTAKATPRGTATAVPSVVPSAYVAQGLARAGTATAYGKLNNGNNSPRAGNHTRVNINALNAEIAKSVRELETLAEEQGKLAGQANRMGEKLQMPVNPALEQEAQRELNKLMPGAGAPKGGKRTRRNKKSKTRRN